MAGPDRNNYASDCSGRILEEDREVWPQIFPFFRFLIRSIIRNN